MPIDNMKAARFYLEVRKASREKKAYEAHTPHTVMTKDSIDPSLTNRLVYGNRYNWYVSAAINGLFDVDVPAKRIANRYLPPEEVLSLSPKNKKVGMSLYE